MPEVIYDAGSWIYKMFMTFIVAAVSIGIVGLNVVNDLNTIDIQRGVMLSRILYSPDSMWYSENGVVFPGVVDLSKFDQLRFDKNFNFPSRYGGANITLYMGAAYRGGGVTDEEERACSDASTCTDSACACAYTLDGKQWTCQYMENFIKERNCYSIMNSNREEWCGYSATQKLCAVCPIKDNLFVCLDDLTSSTIFINEATFRNLQSQVEAGIQKSGSLETHVYPVLIRSTSGNTNGYLYIRLAMPETT